MDYNVDNIEAKPEILPNMNTDLVLHSNGKFQRAKIFGFNGKIKPAFVDSVIEQTVINNTYELDPEQIVPSEALYNDTPETLAGDVLKRVDLADGVDVNYRETATWYDGSPMDDSKLDNVIFIKKGSKYYQKQIDKNELLKIDTIADLRNFNGYYEGQDISLLGYYESGDKEPLNYKFKVGTVVDDGGSMIVSSKGYWEAQFGKTINVRDFGAKGDGLTDDYNAISNALSIGSYNDVVLPSGVFLVSESLNIVDFRRLIGRAHLWNSNERTTVIKYIGEENSNIAVIHNSKSSIGSEPTNAISSSKISNIVVDANNLAGYGIYSAYAINESEISDVTAINALVKGISIDKSWYSKFYNLTARDNKGCGISIGQNSWGGVNGCYINNIQARANGGDETFDPDTNPLWGFGLGLFQGANLVATNVICEQNYGAGVVISNNTAICGIRQGYFEANGASFSQNWGIIYSGISNGRGHFIEDVYLHGVHTAGQDTQYIALIGDEPFDTLKIKNVFYGRIYSQIESYTLENVSYQISRYIVGKLPIFETPVRAYGRNSFTTVYVRPDGDDNNIGSDVSTALLTLEKAIELANKGNFITTIDCTGCNLHEPNIIATRDITITGGNTGIVTNTVNGRGLTIDTNGFVVNVINFNSISRVIHSGKGVLNVENSTIATTDSQNAACVRSTENPLGKTVLNNLTLSGANSQHATPTSIDVRGSVHANNLTFQSLASSGHIRMQTNHAELDIKTSANLSSSISWNNVNGVVKSLSFVHLKDKDISLWTVKQSTNVTNSTAADATDLATALTLVNELKAKLNAKLEADRVSGQQMT